MTYLLEKRRNSLLDERYLSAHHVEEKIDLCASVLITDGNMYNIARLLINNVFVEDQIT